VPLIGVSKNKGGYHLINEIFTYQTIDNNF